jgi:ribosomal protein S18 acetylase RimI-like enzyme
MTETVYAHNKATAADIAAHLRACDSKFSPALSDRLEIGAYAEKLAAQSERFEAWIDSELAGLVAAYCNAPDNGLAYVTNVSVLPRVQRHGIATHLLERCIAHARQLGFAACGLQVAEDNKQAVSLYEQHGFDAVRRAGGLLEMVLDLKSESADGL